MSTNTYIKAFTMAEVLITLGIIGIVAAMTLPTVINNARNKELEARFKQAYSLVYQAVLLMGNDDPQLWQTYCAGQEGKPSSSYASFDFLNNFSKQFQTLSVYKQNTTNLKTLGYKNSKFYMSFPGKIEFNHDAWNNGAFITKNGMIIFNSGCWWNAGLDFVVDTNGHKGPNKFGYDVFYFQIDKDTNQLLPSTINKSFSNLTSERPECCGLAGQTCPYTSDNGSACSKFALMDRFPGDESKSYWKNLPQP